MIVEEMKYYTFYRESNDFKDILSDPVIKTEVDNKIKWNNHLLLGFKHNVDDKVLGYIVLKYGDDIVNLVNKDYTPIPYKDYIPQRR